MTVFEYGERFHSEVSCRDQFFRLRWPKGFICPVCGSTRSSDVKRRELIRCLDCLHETSVTDLTVLHRTKLPLRMWFWAVYLVATSGPGISAMELHRQLGLKRYEPAFQMLHKIRSVAFQKGEAKLSGAVQVDETFIGFKKHGPRGRGALGKTIVVAAVEVRGGSKRPYAADIRMRAIPNASSKTLGRFIRDRIESGARVYTDDWSGYNFLASGGYRHQVVDRLTELEHVHHMFANLKNWLRGTHHHVSRKHMQAYLNEFCYRYNGRHERGLTFDMLMKRLVNATGPTQKRLKMAGRRGGWVHPNVPHGAVAS